MKNEEKQLYFNHETIKRKDLEFLLSLLSTSV
jgi:hypothetical protein